MNILMRAMSGIFSLMLIRLFLPFVIMGGMMLAAIFSMLGMYIANLFTHDEEIEMGGAALGMFLGLWFSAKLFEKFRLWRMDKIIEKIEASENKNSTQKN